MHIRDGFLSPDVCLATGLLSLAAVGFSLRKIRFDLDDKAVPITGTMAAVVFAGQMVNFPLIGLPVSGHLLGGVLASTILGPWAGCLAITLVLIVQAVLFNDGGLLSLGANVLNMAVIGGWGGYAIYSSIRRMLGQATWTAVPASIVAAWTSVLAAAALFCGEFAASSGSKEFHLGGIFSMMVLYHALIGVGEALITGAILSFVLARRPEMVPAVNMTSTSSAAGRFAIAGFICALAIAAVLSPLKSEFPDGLDHVSEQAGFNKLDAERQGLVLNDYEIQIPVLNWWPVAATSIAGIVGTSVVFAMAIALGKTARMRLAAEGGHANT
jgi:cobalt/nickel transport system permease protein